MSSGSGTVDHRRLTRSPLINVLWQVKFTSDVKLSDGRAVMAIQGALKHNTSLAPVQEQVAFQLSMGGPQPVAAPSADGAWRLTADEGKTVVTVAPGTITIETSDYESWEGKFQSWIGDLLGAVVETLSPGVTTRVGLRYVNVIFGKVLGVGPLACLGEFVPYVHPGLLGFGVSEEASDVTMIQGRQVLALGETRVNLNHAMVQTETAEVGLLIDVDAYLEATAEFEADAVLLATDQLHEHALSVFQQCVTPEAWLAMGPVGDFVEDVNEH